MKSKIANVMLLLLILVLISMPAFATDHAEERLNSYTDTTNAVFDRLNGKIFKKPTNKTPGGYQVPVKEQAPQQKQPIEQPAQQEMGENQSGEQNNNSNSPGKQYLVPGIPDFQYDSVLEKMQENTTISSGDLVGTVDSIGASIHSTVSQWLISISPVLLIIAAGMMLFSSTRAISFLLLCGFVIFMIIFAPELVQIFISSIAGFFH